MSKRILLPVSLLIIILYCFSAGAQDKNDRLKIEDIFNYETVSSPQISPDGSKIIYVRRFCDIMTDKRYSNLWIINFDGSDNRPLTTGHYNDGSPQWSPDGTQIIYVSNRDGKSQIYKRYMDTGQTVKLTNLINGPGNITWSPDGKSIAFTMSVKFDPPKIANMPKKPAGAKWAEPAIIVDRLVYRRDQSMYVTGHTHLFVLPAEGGTPRQITEGNYDHGGNIEWTPDSQNILMSVNRNDELHLARASTEIYEYRVSDGRMTQLTNRKGADSGPAISSDGKMIAYTGFDDKYQGFQLTYLYLMNRDGSNPKVVIDDLDRSVSGVTWSSDGKGLYFVYTDKGDTKLAYTDLKGKHKILTGNLSRGSYHVAENGNYAFTYISTSVPADIASGNTDRGNTKLLTAVNGDLFSFKKIGKVEEIWYKSSFDQRDIHGWIIKPPKFDPSKKYPLIIAIHGGPYSNYGFRFNLEHQLFAAAGYVVLYTNPRGSTSYGEEFASLINHNYPSEDFYDLNSGVDAVIEKGYIDTDNLFVTGGSGGGVLTSWMIGNTDRFRAAATIYPVINWYSWVLTTDISVLGVKYWFPGMPWDNVEHYEKRNLLSVVKNVKTPTMVMCGEHDWRCPISESEQYYQALKLLGVEAVMVRVPNEPHGISRRPSHHISKVSHIISWFDRYKQ